MREEEKKEEDNTCSREKDVHSTARRSRVEEYPRRGGCTVTKGETFGIKEEARVYRASATPKRDGRKRGKKWESRRAAFPGGRIPLARRRELRGSGARECIIKKQETSSFSPPLVKILNGDFMLPALLTRASFLLPRLFAAPIPMVYRLCAWVCTWGGLAARNGDSIY